MPAIPLRLLATVGAVALPFLFLACASVSTPAISPTLAATATPGGTVSAPLASPAPTSTRAPTPNPDPSPTEEPTPTPATDLAEAQGQLKENLRKWDSQGIRDYEVTLRRSCFCPVDITAAVKVIVRDGVVTSGTRLDVSQPLTAAELARQKTVDELFQFIQDAIDRKAHRISVNYDPALGYPTSVSVDYDFRIADEEQAWMAQELTLLHPGVGGISLNFMVFNVRGASNLMGEFAPYVRPGDVVTVVSGNNAGVLNAAFVNGVAAAVKSQFSNVKVEAVTCGLANLQVLAQQAAAPIEAVGHICEPSQSNLRDFKGDEAWALDFFRRATVIARSHGFRSVAHPAGRPLLDLGMPRWDYGKLALETDELFVQTQTYCRRGDFEAAISRLARQFSDAGIASPMAAQITVGVAIANAAPAETAAECAATAKRHGFSVITNWWETDTPAENSRFLELIRPLAAPGSKLIR